MKCFLFLSYRRKICKLFHHETTCVCERPGRRIYSMSFFALKNRLRYSTCHVARPSKQHIPKILKNSTRLLVDSGEEGRSISAKISQLITHHLCPSSPPHASSLARNLARQHQTNPRASSAPTRAVLISLLRQSTKVLIKN